MDHGDNPYETLPGTQGTSAFMIAGALAGVSEHCVVYPVDVVRTRMQSIKPVTAHDGFIGTLSHLIKTEKFKAFRGMSVVVVGAAPAHALYFSCYENLKRTLYRKEHDRSHNSSVIKGDNVSTRRHFLMPSDNTIAHALAGCGATVMHDAIMNPVEVIKQRMQVYKSPFRTPLECAKHIRKTDGLGAFYRSYPTQLTMNIPYHVVHFVTYEKMQDLTNQSRKYNVLAHILSGGVAGAFASAITNPLDVCKTLLNTQEKLVLCDTKKTHIRGLFQAMRTVYKCCGFRGFFQGTLARMVVAAPSTAISWTVYEFFKYKQKCFQI